MFLIKKKPSIEPKLEVLYVHPFAGNFNYSIIPTGVIPLMNKLQCSKKGMFYSEVKKIDIKNTKIIAMDLHWFYSLYPVYRLCKKYKNINPNVKIILGGYTAAIFADIIIKRFNCDFIIKGDADYSFNKLVNSLLNKTSYEKIPNLVTRKFTTPFSYSLTQKEFDKCNYTNLDWFPSLQNIIRTEKKPPFIGSTFIQSVKGCLKNCRSCYGNQRIQKILCNRYLVFRSPKKIANDFHEFSQNNLVSFVYSIDDFINFFEKKQLKKIFNQKYNLNFFYHFCSFFDDFSVYRNLSKSFKHVRINLPIYYNGCIKKNVSTNRLITLLEKTKKLSNVSISLLINKELKYKEKEKLKRIIKYFKHVKARLDDYIIVNMPTPYNNKNQLKEYKYYFILSEKRQKSILFKIIIFLFNQSRKHKIIGSILEGIFDYLNKQIIFNKIFYKILFFNRQNNDF